MSNSVGRFTVDHRTVILRQLGTSKYCINCRSLNFPFSPELYTLWAPNTEVQASVTCEKKKKFPSYLFFFFSFSASALCSRLLVPLPLICSIPFQIHAYVIFLAVRTPDDSCCWNKSILPLYCKWKYKPVWLKGRTRFDTIFAGLKLAVAFPDIRRKRDFRSFLGVYGCIWFVCWKMRTVPPAYEKQISFFFFCPIFFTLFTAFNFVSEITPFCWNIYQHVQKIP